MLRLPTLSGIGLSMLIHLLLEAQEYYTDLYFGTHNVRGASDTINDLLAGALGSTLYAFTHKALRGW